MPAGGRGGAREWVGRGRARPASSQAELAARRILEVCVPQLAAAPGTMSRESRPEPRESSVRPGGALRPAAALHLCLSPPQGGVSHSGSRGSCCCCCCRRTRPYLRTPGSPFRVGVVPSCPPAGAPCPAPLAWRLCRPSSPLQPAKLPLSARGARGGRGPSLLVGWRLSEDPPPLGSVALARGGYRVLWRDRADRISCSLWEEEQLPSSPITCPGPPVPQQYWLRGPLLQEAVPATEGRVGWC